MTKKNLKKIFVGVAIAFACVTVVGSVVGLSKNLNSTGNQEDVIFPTPNVVTYEVRYYAVENGNVVDIYADMYKAGGKYPTSYTVGTSLYVDDLLGKMTPVSWDGWNSCYAGSPVPDRENPNKDYSFYGWYTDIGCTKEFEQGKRYAGDITLYAKVEVGYWTGNY